MMITQQFQSVINRSVLAAALCVGVAATQVACHHEEHHEEAKASFVTTSPLKTNTEITRDYVCQIRSVQHIEVRALERGYLTGVYIDEGKAVKKGTRMFQIMPLIYQAELQKATAEAEFAEIEYQNTKVLKEGNVVSANELALAKAKFDKAKAEMALAQAHLTLTEVKAPFDGIMDRLRVRMGSLVEEGELLTTLSDNSEMWVYFNVTEAEYLDYKMHKDDGQPTFVKLIMANNKEFDHQGEVKTIEAEFNNETGNIAFRATFPNPKGLLRHGETGKVIMTTPMKDVVVIPQNATFEVLDKKFVYVVDKEGKVHSRHITVAAEVPHLYIIGEGVTPADRIMLEGINKVRDGDQVAVAYKEPAEVIARLDLHAE